MTLEMTLTSRAGDAVYRDSLIAHWMGTLLSRDPMAHGWFG
jgi:hypothetical protein